MSWNQRGINRMTNSSIDHKRQMAEHVTTVFFCGSIIAFIVVFVAILLGLIVPLCLTGAEKLLAAKLIYSATAMLIGGFEIMLGILLALIGLTAEYDIDASAGPAKVKLASASPGLLLVVCGNLLLGFSLMREFNYREMESQGPQSQQMTHRGASPTKADSVEIPPMPAGAFK
jgi:hypothetical protein